jgi:hypothetical protein
MHGSHDDKDGGAAAAKALPGAAATERHITRRPYVAPAIEESSDFETLALACAGSPVICDPEDPVDPQEPSS